MLEKASFNVSIQNIEKVNPEFAKVKVFVMYPGKNRNHTYISKETVEKMIYSLKNIPVVGEWIEEDKNFGGHGGRLEIDDKGFRFVDTTKPYGVVPSDTEISWETVREKNGIDTHEYLTCTAYLWYGRYPEIEKILNNGANQSMEIMINDGYMDDEGYYVINDATFSALCILGKDSDPDKNVEPCFESSSVTRYTLNREEFEQEFTEMVNNLKFTLQNISSSTDDVNINTKEGGVDMDNVTDVFTEETETTEEVTTTEEEVVETTTEETVEVEETTEEVDYAQLIQGYEEKINQLTLEIENLQTSYATLEGEVTDLREFKQNTITKEREIAENELFERFSHQLTLEEVQTIKESSSELSLEEVEMKLFALVGKKLAKFSAKPKEKTSIKINIGNDEEIIDEKSYAYIISKYAK